MNKKLFLSFVGISLCISFILGAAIIVGIRSLNESGEGRIRYPALRFLARFVEHEQNNQVALGRFEAMRKRLGLKTRPVWILDGNGHVIAETPLSLPLPPPWRSLTKPLPIHRVLAHYQPFHLTPDYMAIRLDSTIPTFLLLRTSTSKSFNRFILGQAALLFTTMAASALAGLAVTMSISYIAGSIFPLIAYLFFPVPQALPISIVLTALALVIVGVIKGKLAGLNILWSTLEIVAVGALSAGGGYLLGVTIPRLFGY